MMDMQNLLEFEEAIKSGRLEECFRNGTEESRYQILGLLEKFMDVADLADEAATRMIFHSQAGSEKGVNVNRLQ